MYLSRLLLNARSRQVQRELANPYEMHRTICTSFPKVKFQDNTSSGILFRVDENPRTGQISLLVQSHYHPDWSAMTQPGKTYLLPPEAVPDLLPNPAVKPFHPTLATGQTLAFRLLANPTKRLSRNAEKNAGKRIGLTREEDQLAWLHRKLENAGCTLLSVRSGLPEKITGSLRRDDVKHALAFQAVRYEGVLQIQNPDQFFPTLRDGIGPAKGLGFGLLSLAPVRG